MKKHIRLAMSLIAIVSMSKFATAEKIPRSVGELRSLASVIVVASIEDIRIETEPSYFERRPGNTDWGIYLTLRVNSVEKGSVSNERLVAKCFRIKARNSKWEYFTPSGHHPIPAIGTNVRVYLERESASGSWKVILPNGITSIESTDPNNWPVNEFSDAPEVTQLRNNHSELSDPIEFWSYCVFLGMPMLVVGICFVYWFRRTRKGQPVSDATGQSRAAKPAAMADTTDERSPPAD